MSIEFSSPNNGVRGDELASIMESAHKMPGISEALIIHEHVEACEALLNAALSAMSTEVPTTVSNRTW